MRTMICAMAVLLAGAQSALAAGPTTPVVGGTVTVTGTDGKDELRVAFDDVGDTFQMTVEPAATVTSTNGPCAPVTDPLTARATHNECRFNPPVAVVVNPRAGDDALEVQDPGNLTSGITVTAGAGNDTVSVNARSARTLKGEDGNDLLRVAGDMVASTNNQPVTFDGGTGIDTAAWSTPNVQSVAGAQRLGVSASLATGSATFSGLNSSEVLTTFRTDTLAAVENLTGTQLGDVLTGNGGPNVLTGDEGPDNLSGGDGADQLFGGNDLDRLDGGKDSDAIDGGLGIDLYPAGGGLDTYNTRDGYLEDVTCVKNDVIVNDLVDKVLNNTATTACSISTAAAKHVFDTHISGRPAKVGASGNLVTKVSCPELKTEACEGEVEALLGKKVLGRAGYRVAQGRTEKVRLPLKMSPERAAGRKIVLSAKEIDPDGRDRFVSRPTRVEKLGPRV